MTNCDRCRKVFDDRSAQERKLYGVTLYLCLTCDNGYTDDELDYWVADEIYEVLTHEITEQGVEWKEIVESIRGHLNITNWMLVRNVVQYMKNQGQIERDKGIFREIYFKIPKRVQAERNHADYCANWRFDT